MALGSAALALASESEARRRTGAGLPKMVAGTRCDALPRTPPIRPQGRRRAGDPDLGLAPLWLRLPAPRRRFSTERDRHSHRRPGLRRHVRPRQSDSQNAEPRHPPRREPAADRLPRRPGLHADTRGTDDRTVRTAQQGRHGPCRPESDASRHTDHAGDLPRRRIRHRAVRQVAPRRHLSAQAAGPRLRARRVAQGVGIRIGDRVRQRLLLHAVHRSGGGALLGPLLHRDLVRRRDGMDGGAGRPGPAVLHVPGAEHAPLPLQRAGEELLRVRQPGGGPAAGPLPRPDRNHRRELRAARRVAGRPRV